MTGEIKFEYFLDRGSDEDERFQDIADLLTNSDTVIINEYSRVEKAVDKSVMHKKLKSLGIKLPHTVIVPPYEKVPDYKLSKISANKLGSPFVAKPAYYSGGSEGVRLDSRSMNDVNNLRMLLYDDNYLLQELIIPTKWNNRRTWFRSFWFFNEAVPVWWDDQTHNYELISQEEFDALDLRRLTDLTEKIAELTGLHYFSCEAAIDENNELILIDYVNDQCDMRLKSKHADGVPDKIVDLFIAKMLGFARSD
jgi:glutathione synthase/RimK-type ligase-like ATP-grasp enzyme